MLILQKGNIIYRYDSVDDVKTYKVEAGRINKFVDEVHVAEAEEALVINMEKDVSISTVRFVGETKIAYYSNDGEARSIKNQEIHDFLVKSPNLLVSKGVMYFWNRGANVVLLTENFKKHYWLELPHFKIEEVTEWCGDALVSGREGNSIFHYTVVFDENKPPQVLIV